MGSLKVLGVFVGIVVLAGTVYHLSRAPEGAPERPDPTAGTWGYAEYEGFTLPLPNAWLRNRQPVPGRGMSFLGPEVDGFRPHVILYWRPTGRTPERWIEDQVKQGVGAVHASVPTSLAGLRAHLVVRDTERKGRAVRMMDWYFAREGRGGIFRAVAPVAEHGAVYRPFFLRIARELRLDSR